MKIEREFTNFLIILCLFGNILKIHIFGTKDVCLLNS
jgi:hypothetical protein